MIIIGEKYEPIIKGKGFNPRPIATWGIPEYADSIRNPRVFGTVNHEQFWLEQIDRCLHGYTTGGTYIPGRMYKYLNFDPITTVGRGSHYPEFVDIDLEYFNLVDWVKENNKGIIGLKARRKGLSEKHSKGVHDYGMRFTPGDYKGGICAGKENYAEEYFNKLKEANRNKPPELQLHYSVSNKDEYTANYSIKTSTGMVEDGSGNAIICKTMFNDPNVFKGYFFNDVIFEEAGEFLHLKRGYGATKACFMVGFRMVGTPYIYGTGGNMKTSTKEFAEIYDEAEHYDLVKVEIMAQRLMIGFFSGSVNEKGQPEENIPNIKKLYPDLSKEQIMGCEDVLAADEFLESQAKKLASARNKVPYYDFLQNFPRNRRQAFLRFTGNNFDIEALNDVMRTILETRAKYKCYTLEYVKNDDGSNKQPLEVHAVEIDIEKSDPEAYIKIYIDPKTSYKDLDVAGIDSYDQDISMSSKSLGAMVILRRKENNIAPGKRIPIALIRCRPSRKEIFYEISMKAAIYFNLIGNVLIDAHKPMIIKYFENHGCEKYLAPRPRSFESPNSEQKHKYGVLLTKASQSKPQMISVLQTWTLDEAIECPFEEVIAELQEYDIEQVDSDWDAADALGIALIRDIDMRRAPRKHDSGIDNAFRLPTWHEREDGTFVDMGNRDINKKTENAVEIKDPFIRGLERGEY